MITPQDIYNYLEGYEIDATEISEDWINTRLERYVMPLVQDRLGIKLDGIRETKEIVVSGHGGNSIVLPDKTASELISVNMFYNPYIEELTSDLTGFELQAGGILVGIGRIFPKGQNNIKITYKSGWDNIPVEIEELFTMQGAIVVLNHLANRTGGGSLNVNSYGKPFGDRGMYTNIVNQLNTQSMKIVKKYRSGVVQI